ncbi:hypothetical protein HYH03_012477 [Edaphochlamys debaryana]|uniref:Uncharacterized protein n=1 Tax=Edaphochlamys debaryana TaxID=47281 RepID=A0A836BVI3_9CHLO|nr:hypothetical protein HYH03_012477 [Edaphochlamys debaryana]|eukprot:KAG2489039.1 hypothetical protein HYH03_012477 [Edaphochlamys debaryana]
MSPAMERFGPQPEHQMCPVFRPSKEEFEQPFSDYVRKIFRRNPNLPMFKVVPPKGWKPRRAPFPDLRQVTINVPIRQHVFGTKGAYRCLLVEQKPLSVADFKLAAEEEANKLKPASRDGQAGGSGPAVRSSSRSTSARHYRPPSEAEAGAAMAAQRQRLRTQLSPAEGPDGAAAGPDPDAIDPDLERAFWANVTLNPPMYGADTPTSFFDSKLPYGWNLQNLGDLLQTQKGVDAVPGVTTPMTYFGMWRSFFAWHKEDADLYSVNFLHWGAPKIWYCVAPSDRHKFERMANSLFPELHRSCAAFVRHKDIMLSPACLKTYGVPCMRACQRPNEFVVLNAAAYHSGWNAGFNCAEAVNFALKEWIPIGKEAVPCKCQALPNGVRISMRLFDPHWVDPYETESESSEEASESEDASEAASEDDKEVGSGKRRRRPSAKARASKAGKKSRAPPKMRGGKSMAGAVVKAGPKAKAGSKASKLATASGRVVKKTAKARGTGAAKSVLAKAKAKAGSKAVKAVKGSKAKPAKPKASKAAASKAKAEASPKPKSKAAAAKPKAAKPKAGVKVAKRSRPAPTIAALAARSRKQAEAKAKAAKRAASKAAGSGLTRTKAGRVIKMTAKAAAGQA